MLTRCWPLPGSRRSKYDILMEKLSSLLSGRPGQMDTLGNIREELVSCWLLFPVLGLYSNCYPLSPA